MQMRRLGKACAATAALVGLVALDVGSITAQQQSPPPTCDGPEYRQFDFWLGSWDVLGADRKALEGTNDITLEENGCLIHEHWKASDGTQIGQSFNFFDRQDKQWHQVWVESHGGVLALAGRYEKQQLVYLGSRTDAQGKAVMQKLTFFRNDDGTVRQLWESSADAGKSWKVVFDGLYKKRA